MVLTRPLLILLVVLLAAAAGAVGLFLWQRCPSLLSSQSEVYLITTPKVQSASEAQALAARYGARVASPAQVQAAFQAGANWCVGGWANDGHNYTLTQQASSGCGHAGVNQDFVCGPNYACALGVLAYGRKPAKTLLGMPTSVAPFDAQKGRWSQFCA